LIGEVDLLGRPAPKQTRLRIAGFEVLEDFELPIVADQLSDVGLRTAPHSFESVVIERGSLLVGRGSAGEAEADESEDADSDGRFMDDKASHAGPPYPPSF